MHLDQYDGTEIGIGVDDDGAELAPAPATAAETIASLDAYLTRNPNLPRAAVRRAIHDNRKAIEECAGTVGAQWPRNASSITLLGTSTKIEKVVDGVNEGFLMAVQYLSPADEAFPEHSKRTTCAFATTCWKFKLGNRRASLAGENPKESGCLVIAGQMAIPRNKGTRIAKTALYFGWPAGYRRLIGLEIAALETKARKQGKTAAVRLDGTSDLGHAGKIAESFPGVVFWDYTKVPARVRRPRPANWHVTFSYDGSTNAAAAREYLERGGNVSAVLAIAAPKGNATYPALPATFELGGKAFPAISGDETDARFTDAPGTINLLTFKQKTKGGEVAARADGFAVDLPGAAAPQRRRPPRVTARHCASCGESLAGYLPSASECDPCYCP